MKLPRPMTLALPLVILLATCLSGQGSDPAAIREAAAETLLLMPEPPLGYVVTKHPVVEDDRFLGFRVQVMKENDVSKVLINIETRDLSQRDYRVAACKGYINGLAKGLRGVGFRVTAQELPDLAKASFEEPVLVSLTFADDNKQTLLVHKRMFFTMKGYDLTVVADSEEKLKMLTDWSTQIQPAISASKVTNKQE